MKDTQYTKLFLRFGERWRGPCTGCADIGIGPQSFTRLVHAMRLKYGKEFILSEYIPNAKFSGEHKEYWLNPSFHIVGTRAYRQLSMFESMVLCAGEELSEKPAENHRFERVPFENCEWKWDDQGQYETQCGDGFVLITGTPEENHYYHCPRCGKRIDYKDTLAEVD